MKRNLLVGAASAAVVLGALLGMRALIPPPTPPLSYSLSAPSRDSVAPLTSNSFNFISLAPNGKPVRWNPCQPIRYVTNLSVSPPGAQEVVRESLRRTSDATGINFEFKGTTSEVPSTTRLAYLPEQYGKDWAPMLIAWTHSASTDVFTHPRALGYGGPTTIFRGERPVAHISGVAALNADRVLPMTFGNGTTWGMVTMHELGHAIGLDHVTDPTQIMAGDDNPFPESFPVQWGAGDLAGLKLLGRSAGCINIPKARR